MSDRLTAFYNSYVDSILWVSSSEEDGIGACDLSEEAREEAMEDCRSFLSRAESFIERAEQMQSDGLWSLPSGVDGTVLEYAGHDFAMTRQGAGVGFWDGDWPEEIGEKLDAFANSFYEISPYAGDDGKVYGF